MVAYHQPKAESEALNTEVDRSHCHVGNYEFDRKVLIDGVYACG